MPRAVFGAHYAQPVTSRFHLHCRFPFAPPTRRRSFIGDPTIENSVVLSTVVLLFCFFAGLFARMALAQKMIAWQRPQAAELSSLRE